MLEFGEMGNIKVSIKMLAMFGLIILFPKVGIDVVKMRCIMHAFAQKSTGFNFGERRFPVMVWLR